MASHSDLFTRGDNNSLGASWAESEGDVSAIRIVSNQLFMDSGASTLNGHATFIAGLGTDHDSQLTFISNGSSAAARSGPGARQSGTNLSFTGYAALYDGTTIILRKYVAEALNTDFTAGTTLGSYTVTLTNGDTVRIEAIRTSIKVFVNGVERISVTDSAITTGEAGVVNNRFGAGANRSTTWDTWLSTDYPRDVTAVWAYTKIGNQENYDWVTGNEDPSKSPRFRDYQVEVYSKANPAASWVLRRTELVTTEAYTYTEALNTADAGSFMRHIRFDIRIRETTGVSPIRSVETTVVS